MKIKKIKSNGLFVYPATIAAAVKDANFLKEGNVPMTLGEVNLYLNLAILDNEEVTAASLNDLNDRVVNLEDIIENFLNQLDEIELILRQING